MRICVKTAKSSKPVFHDVLKKPEKESRWIGAIIARDFTRSVGLRKNARNF